MATNPQTSQSPSAISNESLNKLLANPISSYFSDAYNTLISIVQGLALGGLFVVLADPTYRASSMFWKGIEPKSQAAIVFSGPLSLTRRTASPSEL